jgi:hypothetical protein
MIAKNIKGKSFQGCVSYVMHEGAELLEAEGVLAETRQDIIHCFAMQRSGRSEVKQPVGHIPLSFAPEDKQRMTNDFMVQLAKEYMEEMGINNTQYIIVRHHNAENEHVHIVYNRIDNNLKLISVNHDYKRNIKVCKKLKDRHNLTYGEGKEKVKREKLRNPDKAKYYIYDSIKSVIADCKTPADLQFALKKFEIETEFKLKRTTGEVEGISFSYGNISFKGSQVDRKFSYGNLKKEFEKNVLEQQQKEAEQVHNIKHDLVILGVELMPEQEEILKSGHPIFLENMKHPDGKGKFSAYVFLNDEKDSISFSMENPETFVKYGKYEMRLRDKILIEKGYITKAKVKWYGMGNYAYPYLWKENKSDAGYKESWENPKLPQSEKQKVLPRPKYPKKNMDKKL